MTSIMKSNRKEVKRWAGTYFELKIFVDVVPEVGTGKLEVGLADLVVFIDRKCIFTKHNGMCEVAYEQGEIKTMRSKLLKSA
jgi:hypothetical protein